MTRLILLALLAGGSAALAQTHPPREEQRPQSTETKKPELPRSDEPHAIHCPPDPTQSTDSQLERGLPVGGFGSATSYTGSTQTQPK